MYQVVIMFGDNEPWWFFENWEDDIEIEESFDSFEEAQAEYEKKNGLQSKINMSISMQKQLSKCLLE